MTFSEEIQQFLIDSGLHCEVTSDYNGVLASYTGTGRKVFILLVPVCSNSISEAEDASKRLQEVIGRIVDESGEYPRIISQDRWYRQDKMMKSRLLAHLEIFTQIYARNCEVRKIDKKTATTFLEENHSYGYASCRYRYGLFLKRHTGHNASDQRHIGELVAVATFSNARRWIKGDKTIRSYEWTRYAALPHTRISGGMGKLLKAFIKDIQPDDIMTYADLEWSEGKVYEALGFVADGVKSPVNFVIDTDNWSRNTEKFDGPWLPSDCKFYTNLGSYKYRLKLTDYQ